MRNVYIFLLFLSSSVLHAQQRTVVPVIAWGASGASGNRWFTEVYLSNPGETPQDVVVAGVQVLRLKEAPHPCAAPVSPIRVPPLRTHVVLASELTLWLGCPEEFVGGLLLEHSGKVLVATRMTNTRDVQHGDTGTRPLQGYSQEILGVPVENLVGGQGSMYMVPGLLWHPHACGATDYDTYLYFNNPGDSDVSVRLLARNNEPMSLRLGNVEVQLPYVFKVPAGRVVQLAVQPPSAQVGQECGRPEVFDLFFEAEGKLAVVGSVVDRASNDARTVPVGPENRVTTP